MHILLALALAQGFPQVVGGRDDAGVAHPIAVDGPGNQSVRPPTYADQYHYVTWGALTVDAGAGLPYLALDGGAGTYLGDPFPLLGMIGLSVVCTEPSTPSSGSINYQVSNDGSSWSVNQLAAGITVDGGVLDAGFVLAAVNVTAPLARPVFVGVAAQTDIMTCTWSTKGL